MPFEPLSPVGGFTATPELPRPDEDADGIGPGFGETLSSAFRTENTIGSIRAAHDSGYDGQSFDRDFDPWAEIADTPYEAYAESFGRTRNRGHFEAIKADIDRENRDRDTLSRAGALGFVAGTAAGVLDWPTLLPGGAIVRTARGTTSILRSAASVAAAGAVGATASEALLQGSQQLRTAGESAGVIAGSAVLSGLLGAGLAKWVSRSDFDRLAPRVERDFEAPSIDQPDAFEPGSLNPDMIRAYHASPHDFDRFEGGRAGSGEGGAAFGEGVYLAESSAVSGKGGHYWQMFMNSRGRATAYEVEIQASPKALLDWDAPLSDHAPATQAALRKVLDDVMPQRGEWVDRGFGAFTLSPRGSDDPDISLGVIEQGEDGKWHAQSDALSRSYDSLDAAKASVEEYIDRARAASLEQMTGKAIYQRVSDALGSDEAASVALRKAGVPGLRFFDAVSRETGAGTRNVVMFDPDLIRIVRKDNSDAAPPPVGSGRATSAGAMAVERADDTLKSAFGLERAMSFQDPMLRLQTSMSPVSRSHVQELAETPLAYEKNALGHPTAPAGSEMGAPGAVETRIKMWQGPLATVLQDVDNAFLKYRKGRAKRFTGEIPALNMRDTIFGTKALTHREFRFEVAKAMRRADKHEIPEVAEAADAARRKLIEPLKDEAIKSGQLPEDVSVETAESYLMRLYNKDRIIAERDQFKAVVRDWLEGQERSNQGVRSRLANLLSRFDEAEAAASKLEAGRPKDEAKLKELEARKVEVDRVQQFAFKRALERREPIEAQRARIADLGAQVEGALDSLAAMRGLDSRITDMRQIARAIREDDGGDLAALLADAAELEEGVDDILAKAGDELERIVESGDLPLQRREGLVEGGPLPADEVDEAVAGWQFLRDMKARRKPEGLTSFVVRMGGVEDPGGDVRSMLGRKKERPGLIRKGPDDAGPQLAGLGGGGPRKNTLDDMALRAWENGFFPSSTERPTINEFLDALREDYTGNPQVRGEDEAYFVDVERAGQIAEDLRSRGIDPDKFRRESQLRLFLGQEPRAALIGEADAGVRALRLMRKQLADALAPYQGRITALTRDARRKERAESLRQSERGVFATQARSRGRTLADQIFARRGRLEKRQQDLAAKESTVEDLRKAIEEEVGKYHGKSASEAKAALERRAEAERVREEKRAETAARREELVTRIADEEAALARRPDEARLRALEGMRKELAEIDRLSGDPRRLRSADNPVLGAARSIAAQIDKEPGEIDSLADEIIDRILGTPDGRLPYDAHKNYGSVNGASVDARGPLAARQFMIPDAMIERWLENDVEQLLRAYTRTMAADVEIHKRFGSVDLQQQLKEIVEDYAKRSAAATTPAERQKLQKQRDSDVRDLAAIRDRLRGVYALPSNPDGLLVRSGRVVSSLNYMRMLGGMTISAIPDLGGIVFAHGLQRTFGDGLIPLFRNWSGARIAMQEVKMAGTALDMVLDSRAMSIADVMDNYGRHSKFERAVGAAANKFGTVSLQAPWNAAMKQFVGLITQTRILRDAQALAAGKANKKQIERLAAGGISQSNARKIAEQFAKHGQKEGGVWQANTAAWDEGARAAKEALRAALVRDVDRVIITPGQDKPLWMSTEIGRLVGQFKSFAIAAMQRLVIAGLQQRDSATLSGAALMVALGGLVSILKGKISGQPTHSEWGDAKKNAAFLVEAVDRSGLTGWLMDVNSMTEKMTRGAVGLSAITGKPVSRYAQRNLTGSLLGPSVGTVEDALRTVGAVGSGEWNQSNSRTMRRLIPYNNLFYARKLFDEAEAGINGFFGVPPSASQRRAN